MSSVPSRRTRAPANSNADQKAKRARTAAEAAEKQNKTSPEDTDLDEVDAMTAVPESDGVNDDQITIDSNPSIQETPGPETTIAGATTPSEWNGSEAEPVHPLFPKVKNAPKAVLDRALNFVNKRDDVNKRFGLAKVPSNASWGTNGQSDRFLCDPSNGSIVTIWMVGIIAKKWFVDSQGTAADVVNVAITLPCEGDADALRRLFNLERPKRETPPNPVYASKRMTADASAKGTNSAAPFLAIYDAREGFHAKSTMPVLEQSAIGRGDLVLVEANAVRWRKTKDKNARAWNVWGMGFELKAISLLYEGVEEDVPEAVASDYDDDM